MPVANPAASAVSATPASAHALPSGCLSVGQRAQFERDGFLILPQALPSAMVARLNQHADAASSDNQRCNIHDLIGTHPDYLELVDYPTTFPAVWGILGWNIQSFHTQLIVSPSTPNNGPERWGWHQDNNRMNRDLETAEHPRVSVKIAYVLTDCLRPGTGSLGVVPGSHQLRSLTWDATTKQPVGAVEVIAKAGDAILFDRRLWHAGAANHSGLPRKVLYYGYSYRWLRPKSAMALDHVFPHVSPIRRQLLGWASSANGRYDPQDEDVPLRAAIAEQFGSDQVAP